MGEPGDKTTRKPRADAERNRARIIAAAKTVLGAGGSGASLEAVARAAGVGTGTLYRHFPTREALFEAVYRREVEQLAELAVELVRADDPVAALRTWLHANIALVATKKGLLAALELALHKPSDLYAYSFQRLTAAVGMLMRRAVEAGRLRPDISPEDLLQALIGMCTMRDQPGWPDAVKRLIDVFVDGMAIAPAAPALAIRKD